MRPIEILIPTLLSIYLIWPVLTGNRPIWLLFLPIAALLAIPLHIFFEGSRWQMAPLYAMTAVLAALAFYILLGRGEIDVSSRSQVLPGSVIGLILLALSAALPAVLPVPKLPEPTGTFPVGTRTFYWVDESRREIYSDNPQDLRRLMGQVWYPADPEPGATPGPWIERIDLIAPAVAERIVGGRVPIPSFFVNHLKLARTHSYPDASLAADGGPFPVLLFSHGWSGFRNQNTYQMEELASHGYIVAAVDHTYGAGATLFPDGSVALLNPDTLPFDVSDQEYKQAANRLAKQWAQDLGFLLDQLERLNEGEINNAFSAKMNLEQVGLLGHSTGAGAIVEFCAQDDRCKAVLAMDAYLVPVSDTVIESGFGQPALFMFSEIWPKPYNMSIFNRLFENLRGKRYHISIEGTAHYDFTDLVLLTPLGHQLGLKGPIDGRRGLEIINAYSVAFFDRFLSNTNASGEELNLYPFQEVIWISGD